MSNAACEKCSFICKIWIKIKVTIELNLKRLRRDKDIHIENNCQCYNNNG